MGDLRFSDVVIESNKMVGPKGPYHTAVCKNCSTKHHIYKQDFELDVSGAFMKYASEMRAWNCCHESDAPLDGFPQRPPLRITL